MSQELLYAEVVFLVILPIAVGLPLSKWTGDTGRRRGWSPFAVRTVRTLITILWVSVMVVGLSLIFGPFNPLSTLTVSAIGGIAATLALQTTLQNILAGFILLHRRFMLLGDVVQISGVKGTVVGLGLVSTVLKLPDGSLTFVSNSNLLAGPLTNITAGSRLAGEF
jgi:small conductance mechanosensitive channel